MLHITRTEITYKKDGKYCYEVVDHLLNPFGEYLLIKEDKRILSRRYSDRLRTIWRQIGIPPRSLHKLRKTYGTRLLNGKVDEKLVQMQMGHACISTTRSHYYANDKEDAESRLQIEKAINY